MLDFNNILSTPGMDVQYFSGQSTATLTQWQTWRKPRGVKNIYMIGVGGGSSGAVSSNAAASNAGGGGGGSGAQTCVWIPAFFVPDTLYVQCGAGGRQPAVLVSAATQVGGVPTYIAIEPSTTLTANMTLLVANGGASGAVTGGTVATIAGMPLAARGYYTFFVGQSGTAGGAVNTASNAVTYPVTGLMVMGGAGGGGSSGSSLGGGAGGGFTVPAGSPINDFFLPTYAGGSAPSAGASDTGRAGAVMKNFIMNYGGAGGGGEGLTSGPAAGGGGDGAPGSGGGGAGGSTLSATLARPGNGGDGFVIIMSW